MKYQLKPINGGVTMKSNGRKKLDMSIVLGKKSVVISTKESLKDVTPIEWPEDVLAGKRKIIVG